MEPGCITRASGEFPPASNKLFAAGASRRGRLPQISLDIAVSCDRLVWWVLEAAGKGMGRRPRGLKAEMGKRSR